MSEISKFESLPGRIFFDTNILQYLQDFGEFIFDDYQEDEKYLIAPKGEKIASNSALYKEVKALRFLLLGIDRTNIEFVISESTYNEVKKAESPSFMKWFFDIWDYWQTIIEENYYNFPSDSAESKTTQFNKDQSVLDRISKNDRKIIRDAMFFDCDAILTNDKFKRMNEEFSKKYGLMLLSPSSLFELLEPWQALWY
jgi:hypothetical protein